MEKYTIEKKCDKKSRISFCEKLRINYFHYFHAFGINILRAALCALNALSGPAYF